MVKRVITNIFIEELETQGSLPSKFNCDDGYDYITKHYSAGFKHLINEFIAAHLAKEIKLNIPPFALVQIDPEIFSPQDSFQRGKPNGLGFGSRYLDGFLKNLNDLDHLPISTKIDGDSIEQTLLKVVIFDIWIRNDDRSINNPNILVQEVDREFRIFAIDHAAIFAQLPYLELNKEKEEAPTLEDTLIYHPLFIKIKNSLGLFFDMEVKDIILNIKKIKNQIIRDIVNEIPNEWKLDYQQKDKIIEFLEYRKGILKQQFYSILKDAGL